MQDRYAARQKHLNKGCRTICKLNYQVEVLNYPFTIVNLRSLVKVTFRSVTYV